MKTQRPVTARRLRSRPTGFTLIELMVTVAIVAILAALAYPSYRNYVIRGQLVSATNALSAVRANMERYFQDNRTYPAAGTPPCANSVSGLFNLTCASTATTYTLTATGQTSTNVDGFAFTVTETNVQATTVGSPAPSSWTGTYTCWVTKPGSC